MSSNHTSIRIVTTKQKFKGLTKLRLKAEVHVDKIGDRKIGKLRKKKSLTSEGDAKSFASL